MSLREDPDIAKQQEESYKLPTEMNSTSRNMSGVEKHSFRGILFFAVSELVGTSASTDTEPYMGLPRHTALCLVTQCIAPPVVGGRSGPVLPQTRFSVTDVLTGRAGSNHTGTRPSVISHRVTPVSSSIIATREAASIGAGEHGLARHGHAQEQRHRHILFHEYGIVQFTQPS